MLDLLFTHNPEKYGLEFEIADGLDPLQALQYSKYSQVYELAQNLIENFFEGVEIEE